MKNENEKANMVQIEVVGTKRRMEFVRKIVEFSTHVSKDLIVISIPVV